MKKLFHTFQQFPRTFWVANTMELFERWAFYGFFMLFANYLTMSADTGALGLSQTEKGIIMSVGTAILYLLPVITGALADRYGYKPTLFVAYLLYLTSFLVMPFCRSFEAVFLNYLLLALGAALFKPIISATIAKVTTAETSSIGFGMFYLMVNIGAFVGPLVALQFSSTAFKMVFYISALLIFCNMIVLFFFKVPEQAKSKKPLLEQIVGIFSNIFEALRDVKLSVFLLIISGFWAMYYQLFQTLPVFINQWVDTASVYQQLHQIWPWLANFMVDANGNIAAEYFTNTDALFIIAFQLFVSTIVMRWNPLSAMFTGFLVCTIGMVLALLTQNGFLIVAAIFIFSLGEMSGSPKITEYIGRIAPQNKTALYMGCSFLPVALGNLLAGIISGPIYQSLSDKTTLLQSEFSARGISIPEISESFTQNQLWLKAQTDFNLTDVELTNFLWDKYNPSGIWYIIAAVGFLAAFALMLYNHFLNKKLKAAGNLSD